MTTAEQWILDMRILNVIVWFANAKVDNATHVEKRFRAVVHMPPGEFLLAAGDMETHQAFARDCLNRIVRGSYDNDFVAEVAKIINSKIRAKPIYAASRNGLAIKWETHIDSIPAAIGYSFLRLAAADSGLLRRVGLCAYPSKGADKPCAKFFLDKRKSGGRDQLYCSVEHSNADRQRRKRRRDESKSKAVRRARKRA